MARARNIKPGFFQNEQLAEMPAVVRLLFIGLWTIADYRGCIEWRPKRIKVQLLPYDECDMEQAANDLARAGMLVRYEVGGQQYVKVRNFIKHQNPHKQEREAGSELPDVPETQSTEKKQDETHRNDFGSSSEVNVPLTDSLLPHPDSLHTESRVRVSDAEREHFDSIMDGLRTRLKVNTLRDEQGWADAILWAYSNDFTAERFLLCFDLLSRQKWRTGRLTGKIVADNLPNLDRVQRELDGEKPVDPARSDYTPPTYKCEACFDSGFVFVDDPDADFTGAVKEVPCGGCASHEDEIRARHAAKVMPEMVQ